MNQQIFPAQNGVKKKRVLQGDYLIINGYKIDFEGIILTSMQKKKLYCYTDLEKNRGYSSDFAVQIPWQQYNRGNQGRMNGADIT